ncbi:Uncharacterised protein [Acidipropionibacterium jensenii]|uniref:Uncharacterized protein n=2 Tax=Acidipropionibacterium jensenii TaxID=1749 RepID=A0A448NX99_9ACTN|nr:Uncharacterised protein [Acidipropionibacterium jensenii]
MRAVLGALVVILILVLVGWLILRPDSGNSQMAQPDQNSSTPTVSSWNEKSSTPSAGSSVVKCPAGGSSPGSTTNDGRLRSGRISAARISDWADQTMSMPWVRNISSQTETVYVSSPTSWMSVSGVGQLAAADGFSDPRTAARMMTECFASSQYYSGYTGSKVVSQQEFDRNGHTGWWVRTEIDVSIPNLPQVRGDVVDVVVMDTGQSDFMGVYFNSATIGDSARQKLVDAARESIQVS